MPRYRYEQGKRLGRPARRVGHVAAGARCLDLGYGAGDVTAQLARRVGPTGMAVGVDMDVDKLAAAGEYAGALGVSDRTQFVEGNVYDFAVEPGYDVVSCRFVLEHLSRPVEVLRRMWQAVAPGGVIVVEDADFDAQFCSAPDPAFDFWVQNYPELLRTARAATRRSGRSSRPCSLRPASRTRRSRSSRGRTSPARRKPLPTSTLAMTAAAMHAAGIATEEQTAAALRRMHELAADPGVLIGSPRMCQVWARRPRS